MALKQGRARVALRALGLAIALALPGLVMAQQSSEPAVAEVSAAPGMGMVTFNLHHDRARSSLSSSACSPMPSPCRR